MNYTTLAVGVADGIATIELNRPDKANAMNAPMWQEIRRAFEWVDATPVVRVAILRGAGKGFSAGIDLAMLAGLQQQLSSACEAQRREQLRAIIADLQDCVSSVERCRKPVLAAVHGPCVGGAVDLVTACDMRYASADAFFSVREVDMGMVADVGTLQRLPKIVPAGIARELAYTGRNVAAEEARAIGLAERVYPDVGALHAGVFDLARLIATKSPLAVRGTKQMLLHARDHGVQAGLDKVADWNAAMLLSADLQEAIAAFMQKRPAKFAD